MEAISTELVDDQDKRDTRGRKIATGERRAKLLAGYDASGLTQRAYARREGINFHTLVGWLQRRRGEGVAAPAVRFREVGVSPDAMRATPLEVELPGGVVVRGSSAAAVAELVRALSA